MRSNMLCLIPRPNTSGCVHLYVVWTGAYDVPVYSPVLQVRISDFFLITYLQFSYALNTELLEDLFYSLVAHDVVSS